MAPSVRKVPQLYSRAASDIASQLYLGYAQVIFASRDFKGEYNITKTDRFSYHFCRKAKISLQTIVCNITLPTEKEFLFFRRVLPFSKYVTYYDTFTTFVQSVICFMRIKTRETSSLRSVSLGCPFLILIFPLGCAVASSPSTCPRIYRCRRSRSDRPPPPLCRSVDAH